MKKRKPNFNKYLTSISKQFGYRAKVKKKVSQNNSILQIASYKRYLYSLKYFNLSLSHSRIFLSFSLSFSSFCSTYLYGSLATLNDYN